MYENVSTFSALSGDGHRLLWSGFVSWIVWFWAAIPSFHRGADWQPMLYISSYLDNEILNTFLRWLGGGSTCRYLQAHASLQVCIKTKL